MPPRHDDCVFDRADFETTQALGTGGAPELTAEEMALRQVLAQPDRGENEIRAVYGLSALSESGLDEWIAGR